MLQKYDEFINYISTFFSVFQIITADTKEEWIQILREYRFDEEYEITSVPAILNQFGINGSIVLSLKNFAYIASMKNSTRNSANSFP